MFIAVLLSSVWCVSAAAQLGATFDEPTYIAGGLDRWRTGRIGGLMRLGTMPLPVDVATLPLYVIERTRGVPFAITTDARARPLELAALGQVIPVARLSTLVFWCFLLYYGWRAAWDLAGPWGGRLAIVALASEPNLLAHAALATTDIAAAACLVALLYRFRIGRQSGGWKRIGVPAIWFALALLSKASALVFGPVCLLAVALQDRPRGDVLRPAWRDTMLVLVLGIGLTFLYCGSDWSREESFIAWTSTLQEGSLRTALTYVAEHLAIFSNAGEGLIQQVKHNVRGHGAYLLGRTYDRAIWYYFPVALSMKLTVPVLFAALLLAFIRRVSGNYVLLAAAMLIALSVFFRVQTGIRLVLPVVALLMIGLSAGVVQAIASMSDRRRRAWASMATAAVTLGLVFTAIVAWPNALMFTNSLWGGTSKGYLVLSDSNYDWGQGLPALKKWQEQHRVANLAVWYWGTDPALAQGPWQPMALHTMEIQSPAELTERLRGKHLAASTTLVYGSVFADTIERSPEIERMKRTTRELRLLLQTRAPVARTPTFLIYDFTTG